MNKNRFLLLSVLVIIFITATACGSNNVLQPTPTSGESVQPTPGLENTPLEVTDEPTPTPIVTATQEASTTTPEPTVEGEISPTQSPSETPTAIPTETPIPTNPVASINLEPVIEGAFTRPLYLTHAGDKRLFVVEQAGVIRIIDEAGTLLDSSYLDIRDRVGSTQLEQGLLGLAFHPNYTENGAFFVNYTDLAGNSYISRFLVDPEDPNHANPDSETILLSYDQPFPNHNGGQVAFGPDGYLYIGVGDGGSANDPFGNGQNLETLLGTVLRLEVDTSSDTYKIPETNPFVGDANALDEIWAWGLRNPWRFSFDRITGDLFIADVGQNLWEEVDFQAANSSGGENYGWNILEGFHCFLTDPCDSTGLVLPIFEYSHQEGCSVTGGYMYRGSQYPELYGNYFVTDYCQGNIWRLYPEASGTWNSAMIFDSPYVISSFGEDAAGNLYVLDHNGGSIYKITP
jgi:glucose/arabinose dehydrogenase